MRARTMIPVLGLLCVVAASGCAAPPRAVTAAPSASAAATPSPARTGPTLPAGWRWESFSGVEVGVPGSWGWTNGSQRIGQWCVADPKAAADQTPAVGRPGVSTQVGCDPGSGGGPSAETLLSNTGPIVAFERPEKPRDRVVSEGDRTTVGLNGVDVIVQTEPELRKKIVATVHAVTIDDYGCPSTDPVSGNPARRPSPAVDVTTLRAVSAVSACTYAIGDDAYQSDPRLQGSLRLEGDKAATAVRRIAAASTRGGPNKPKDCTADSSYGEQLMVLRVRSDKGETQIYLRYSSCDHNGFDDGHSVRRLDAKSVAAFFTGANAAYGGLGSTTANLIWPNVR